MLVDAESSILDQAQEAIDSPHIVICADWLMAQTFTAGITGQLEQIDLYLENVFAYGGPPAASGPPSYPITVTVVETISSVPSGVSLGQVYVDTFVQGFNSINFLSESVQLQQGVQYAIILSSTDTERYDATSTQWVSSLDDVYSGGAMWSWSSEDGWAQTVQPPDDSPPETFYDKDAAFRTYMTPEPATLLLIGFGAAMLRFKR
jgi:hypothetical protein